jgi:hypothetical protein
MPIDRRITNGLAWAGAFVVVAIPAADVALRQFEPRTAPQVAVVEAEPELPALPTPASQRPAPVVAAVEKPVVSQPPVVAAEPAEKPAAEPAAAPDPVTTASAIVPSGNAVDDFLQSGRPLPSYISGGGAAAPTQTAAVAPVTTAKPVPAPVTTTPPAAAPEQVASVPRTRIVTFPTAVSERPASVPRSQVAAQPALVIDTPTPVVVGSGTPVITASDLEDWESGPLSEFLARRQAQAGSDEAPADYDADGFFLDEGPNSSARVWRFPRAYEDGYYPFE